MSFASRLYNEVFDGRMDLGDAVDRVASYHDERRDFDKGDEVVRAAEQSKISVDPPEDRT